ncbi:MAG: signal recognition particle-docking protein FtsY [Dehalococcoidia bacterium]|nr:MAG: signal recognition particle-docking protein FtsY [Dehalococcoidia bacterium]
MNIFKKALQRSRQVWCSSVVELFKSSKLDEAFWSDLEEQLITADVGVSTSAKIIAGVKKRVSEQGIKDGEKARAALNEEIIKILKVAQPAKPQPSPPKITMVVGVNGSGKTTTIAKLALMRRNTGKKVILAAADTFRAAAIDQLKHLAEKVGTEIVAHQPGADPGAVVYDAVAAARNRGADELIIDTAGRLHTKFNLMEELKKIRRVIAKVQPDAPHEVILVLDATTGQNGLAQARHFAEAVGVTGIILTKLDSTARGGIVLAIADELKIPITYIGTGDDLGEIAPFEAEAFVGELCA